MAATRVNVPGLGRGASEASPHEDPAPPVSFPDFESYAALALRPSDSEAEAQLLQGLRAAPDARADPAAASVAATENLLGTLAGIDLSPRHWSSVVDAFNASLTGSTRVHVDDYTSFMSGVMASSWWQLPGGGVPPRATVSPWKVHFAAQSVEQVLGLAARLAPVLEDRAMASKFAGKRILTSDNQTQNRKGAVVYLPRRATLAEDIAALAAATDGMRADADIPGDVPFARGMGVRCDWALDLGCDLPPGRASLMYIPATVDPLDAGLQGLHAAWCRLRREHPEKADPEYFLKAAYHSDHGDGRRGAQEFVRTLDSLIAREEGRRDVSVQIAASPGVEPARLAMPIAGS